MISTSNRRLFHLINDTMEIKGEKRERERERERDRDRQTDRQTGGWGGGGGVERQTARQPDMAHFPV